MTTHILNKVRSIFGGSKCLSFHSNLKCFMTKQSIKSSQHLHGMLMASYGLTLIANGVLHLLAAMQIWEVSGDHDISDDSPVSLYT
jgi:hypothetical protein